MLATATQTIDPQTLSQAGWHAFWPAVALLGGVLLIVAAVRRVRSMPPAARTMLVASFVLFLVALVRTTPAPASGPDVKLPKLGKPKPTQAAPARPSKTAVRDIPADYLRIYQKAARTCPRLSWQVLAAIGKIESDHGRSRAPGVRSGVNRFGCCAGPMQFNLTNGPPSTWDAYKRPGDSVYNPNHAIPAAARKLCHDGLAGRPGGRDPCPSVPGTPALHRAIKRYNNACWYVRDVVQLARRYGGRV